MPGAIVQRDTALVIKKTGSKSLLDCNANPLPIFGHHRLQEVIGAPGVLDRVSAENPIMLQSAGIVNQVQVPDAHLRGL